MREEFGRIKGHEKNAVRPEIKGMGRGVMNVMFADDQIPSC